jgi:hypothetical protein
MILVFFGASSAAQPVEHFADGELIYFSHRNLLALRVVKSARRLFFKSSSRSILSIGHDPFGKPVPTFPDRALAST